MCICFLMACTYPKIDFNNAPLDQRRAVCVTFHVLDAKDAENLDHRDKKAESKDTTQANLLGASAKKSNGRKTSGSNASTYPLSKTHLQAKQNRHG